jgi:hypothetical protein
MGQSAYWLELAGFRLACRSVSFLWSLLRQDETITLGLDQSILFPTKTQIDQNGLWKFPLPGEDDSIPLDPIRNGFIILRSPDAC